MHNNGPLGCLFKASDHYFTYMLGPGSCNPGPT